MKCSIIALEFGQTHSPLGQSNTVVSDIIGMDRADVSGRCFGCL